MKRQKLLLALTLATVACAQEPPDEPLVTYESGGTAGAAGRGGSSAAAGSGAGRGGAAGTGGTSAPFGGTNAGGSAGSSGGTTGSSDAGGADAGATGSGGSAGSAGSGGSAAGGSAGTMDGAAGTSAGSGGSGGAPATGFSIQYKVEIAGTSGSAIGSQLWIVNSGTTTVNLNDLTLRYYFTNEVTGALIQTVNWANTGPISGGATMNLQSGELTMKTAPLTPAVAGADSYVEFGFNAAGKTLAPGSRIQFSWTVQNYVSQSFNQSGDYSFNAGLTAQTNWQNVVLFQGQSLVWGAQP